MSAHFLLNLLNELRKRDKVRGVPSNLSLFRNEWKNNEQFLQWSDVIGVFHEIIFRFFFKKLSADEKSACIIRVKSGNFGHQVTSDQHLETVEIQMDGSCRLIRIFTVCLVNLFFLFR